MKASVGAQTAGIRTLCTIPCHSTPCSPDWTSAAPTRPPISACDDEEGSPSHQVNRFQTIAPSTAASTVFSLARPESMIPLPTVFATAVVAKAPARVAIAAVALVLELSQGKELAVRVLESLEQLDGLVQPRGGAVDHIRLPRRRRRDLLNLVEADVVGGLVDVVADVVDHRREPVHVVTVE